jgi:hypothetical protein
LCRIAVSSKKVDCSKRQTERRHRANKIRAGELQRPHVGLGTVGPQGIKYATKAKEGKQDNARRRDRRVRSEAGRARDARVIEASQIEKSLARRRRPKSLRERAR